MKVIIHCSDSPSGNASEITKWHVLERGWKSIGYHYVILNGNLYPGIDNDYFDGHIETGRPLSEDGLLTPNEFGAHTLGQNDKSIGICLIGKSNTFTDSQLSSLRNLIAHLKKQFEDIEVYQHSDFSEEKPYCAGLSKDFMDSLILGILV